MTEITTKHSIKVDNSFSVTVIVYTGKLALKKNLYTSKFQKIFPIFSNYKSVLALLLCILKMLTSWNNLDSTIY